MRAEPVLQIFSYMSGLLARNLPYTYKINPQGHSSPNIGPLANNSGFKKRPNFYMGTPFLAINPLWWPPPIPFGGDLVGPRGYYKWPTLWAPAQAHTGTGGQNVPKPTQLRSQKWPWPNQMIEPRRQYVVDFGQKNFLKPFPEWAFHKEDLWKPPKLGHFFSWVFFKCIFSRQFAAHTGVRGVKNFLLVWIFKKG